MCKKGGKGGFQEFRIELRWDQDNCPKTCMRSSVPKTLKLTYINLYETFLKTVGIFMILSLRQQMIDYAVLMYQRLVLHVHVSVFDN